MGRLLPWRWLELPPALSSEWRPLPHVHVERRQVLAGAVGGAVLAAGSTPSAHAEDTSGSPAAGSTPSARAEDASGSFYSGPRSAISVDSHLAIPVWPSWAGGRVVPISFEGPLQDPFLLLAHHKHWFDPRDPLRGPFKQAGKLLGLPYVDVEGFSMHPHRGFDIWTYVLDGSDGFRHRDSLGGERTYRGGTAQWMRSGSGALHEEFWETRSDRRTNIELFQLWVNLGSRQKMDPPAIRYLGQGSSATDWIERRVENDGKDVGWARDLSSTLETASQSDDWDGQGSAIRPRPPLEILHVKLDPGGSEFTLPMKQKHMNAILYVREGVAKLRGVAGDDVSVKALQTATLSHNGDVVSVRSGPDSPVDFLLLAAKPLGEPVAQAGPIVMNRATEVRDAYQQLQDGTFLDREYALRHHRAS
ncbi:hypothetical protein ACHAXT_013117 [Thalassiosira profunda]